MLQGLSFRSTGRDNLSPPPPFLSFPFILSIALLFPSIQLPSPIFPFILHRHFSPLLPALPRQHPARKSLTSSQVPQIPRDPKPTYIYHCICLSVSPSGLASRKQQSSETRTLITASKRREMGWGFWEMVPSPGKCRPPHVTCWMRKAWGKNSEGRAEGRLEGAEQ